MAILKLESRWASENLRALSLGGEVRPRLNDSGVPKLAPNGKPTFSTGVVVARADGGQDRGVTISVTEPVVLQLGAALRPDGDVWVTPYETNGRVGLSIICERLVPVGPVAAAKRPE
ncbi:hypothetical protein GCM10017602_14050 [Herbiconiux flava]|nr:hypothetical protein GCM10017602_14050 [Herbiconiux flava]